MLWVLLIVVALAVVWFIVLYNGIVQMRQFTRNAWADVDVYLKRRAELIPNLVAAVKGYTTHESSLLENLAASRAQALSAGGPTPVRVDAEGQVGANLGRVLLLSEKYPDLKASENFLNLQHELSDTETKIASARQYYNACVRDLNTKIESFPSSIAASVAGVKPEVFFEAEGADREVPSASTS